MVLFNIPDIRLFWSEDERFLSQFDANKPISEQQFQVLMRERKRQTDRDVERKETERDRRDREAERQRDRAIARHSLSNGCILSL